VILDYRLDYPVSSFELMPVHRMDASLKPEAKTAHAVFQSYHGSMVAACCPQSGTLSSFSALTLLIG